MTKTIRATRDSLAKSLEWALNRIPEKYEAADGLRCLYCDAGTHTDTLRTSVNHLDTCPWLRAKLLLTLYRAETHDKGCTP